MKPSRHIGLIATTLLLAGSAVGVAQVALTFSEHATDYGVGLGWAGNTGYIVGERDGLPTLFTFANGTFTATNLVGMDYTLGISADGRNIWGQYGNQGVLTSSGNPGSVTNLGMPPGLSFSEPHGASSGASPTVVGFSGIGSFTYSSLSGVQAFAPPAGQDNVRLTGISANGLTLVGWSQGAGDSDNAFSYNLTSGTFSFANEAGGNHSIYTSVSANGLLFGGFIDDQATLWGPTPIRLTFDGNPLMGQVDYVTDNGFAFGSTGSDGWVYDPRTGMASLLDDWLATENGAPLGHHITGVFGAIWDGVELHLGLEGSMGIATVALTRLSIARVGPEQIQLSWPTNRAGTVEYALQLPAQNWTPLTNAVPVLNSNQFTLTLPVTNAAAFFRLRIP